MYLAKLTFQTDGRPSPDHAALRDAVEIYLVTLSKNGQIDGEYLFAWFNGNLVVYTHLVRPDALALRHHSTRALNHRASVTEAFGNPPRCEIIQDYVPKRFPSWKRSTSFYLFTHAFQESPSLRCGDTGNPIPLYLPPIPPETREAVDYWTRSYQSHDQLWLASGALEIPAYKQLADPASDLSVDGRESCTAIERATQKPTFYYLHRYWGRKEGEATRPCPGCGGKWHTGESPAERPPFHRFHFRCDPCRLVSHCADSYDDERHARIGEFKQKQ